MRAWLLPLASAGAIAAVGWNTGEVAAIANPPIRRVNAADSDNSLAGQFQTSAVGHLWTYTEVYLQNGLKLRKMTGDEIREYKLDPTQNHGIPIIPTRRKDFRGIMGDVERAVTAWDPRQASHRNDPKQTMPLFRLMTWMDPFFVEAWTSGAMIINLGQTKETTARAKEFLLEGLRNNPDSVDIPNMYAMLCIRSDRDYTAAEKYLKLAIENGRKRSDALPEAEELAFQSAYRWLALVFRNTGQTSKMMEVAEEGLMHFPDDLVLPTTIRPSVTPPSGYKAPTGVKVRRK
jgi:hypothetical protein